MPKDKAPSERPPDVCGLIMPISPLDGCPEQHWAEVRDILEDAIRSADMEPNLVSNADDVGIIQKRIIQNLYSNPIVVCDVSGKNPNVMFELGMRLAFDKPAIIVKDDKTSYSFDTSPIEHLGYPRDLRFSQVVDFKAELLKKLAATVKKARDDKTYTTFLKNFGTFTVAKLDTEEVPKEDFILKELSEVQRQLHYLVSRERPFQRSSYEAERSTSPHKLTPIECRSALEVAARLVREAFGTEDDGSHRNPLFVSRRARELGVLPECFSPRGVSCLKALAEILDSAPMDQTAAADG